jgi:TRAP-type mannitol/chloroaromatic compound transport system permease small subunit
MNRLIGRATMYMIFVMIGVLFYSSITKTFFTPALWTLEMAQFLMMAYFFLGGPYAMQIDGHVRMDLLYGSWSERTKAIVDALTVVFLLVYLGILLYGALQSTYYAFDTGERNFSAWRPYMWPIKVVMVFGTVIMLLQTISHFFKDLAAAMGKPVS